MTDRPDPMAIMATAASKVRDPVTGRSIWLAGRVRTVRWEEDGALAFELMMPAEVSEKDALAVRDVLIGALRAGGVDGPMQIEVARPAEPPPDAAPKGKPPITGMGGSGMAPHGGPIVKKRMEGVKHVIAVASGKGGVGKSTIACNLAVGLRQLGLKVGLLDADIYGPSLPTMMNTTQRPMVNSKKQVIPIESYGIRCMSIGLAVEPQEAIIWRGPMVMGALREFLQTTAWGELDVLVVDLPPGTGDAHLSLIQGVELTGAIIVTTPQRVALDDAIRGLRMFEQLKVPLIGVVENMAYYELPDGTRDAVFGSGGGQRVATAHGTALLAQVPLQTSLRRSGDDGVPAVLGRDAMAGILGQLSREVAKKLGFEEAGA